MGQDKKRRFTRPSRAEMRKFRKLLGPTLVKRYSEGQLVMLYHDMHIAVQLLLDLWIVKRQKKGGSSEGYSGSREAEH